MTDKEQTFAFGHELDNLVDRFRSEFEMTYASIVGTLVMKTVLLCDEASNEGGEE